jgi:medium-chain acyl-[acyl-carrier-protein] hydrolase
MLIPIKAGFSAPLRLFCFPYAGAGAWAFRKWKSHVIDNVELYSVQLPGRENQLDRAPFTAMPPLMTALADAIEPMLDRPCVFFGHSLGSLIAFECARELRRRGAPLPQRMIVSGRRAPQIPREQPFWHTMDDEALAGEVRNLGGTPEGVLEHPELRAMFLPMLRADFSLNETYACASEAPLSVPATMLYGRDDATTNRMQALAWREQFASPVRFVEFEGGHFFVEQCFEDVMVQVNAELATALALTRWPRPKPSETLAG